MENGFSHKWWVGCILTISFSLVLQVQSSFASIRKIDLTHQFMPSELIVKLKNQKTALSLNSVTALKTFKNILGSNSVLEAKPFMTDKQIYKIKLDKNLNLTQSIQKLNSDPSIQYAEPNYIMKLLVENPPLEDPAGPNDPDLKLTWGMKNTGQVDSEGQVGKVGSDIGVFPLWQKGFTGDKKVLVAVIDTGVQWDHPDLKDNIFTNTKEDGKDGDGNGFVNDIHGWNFVDNTNQSSDDHGHGTHVSGTIGGIGNNGIGVAGVVWNVSILPVKFLSAQGSGTLEGAVESINYARMMKVNIMSNSWGGGGFTQSLYDAIAAARDAGVIFTAAAGNDRSDNDASPAYPASYEIDNIISVAATDNQDQIANFSNYGKRAVHVAAPGVHVYSTVKDSKYDTYSGTSMATPHVSGIAAMMLSINPKMTYAEVRKRLIETSDPVLGLRKKVAAKGRVNVFNAVNSIVPPTDEPNEKDWVTMDMKFESEHPYKEKSDKKFKIHVDGAKKIRVHFTTLDTEAGYDIVSLESESGETFDSFSGKQSDFYTDYANGDTAYIHFSSDGSVNGAGFWVDKIQYIR